MDDEIKSLESNNTFTVTELPETKTVVARKWVYTIKGNPQNPVYKARYVAKSYSQVEGIDSSVLKKKPQRLTKYHQMVGSLIYAMTCRWPDSSYCVTKTVAALVETTPEWSWIMLKHVFQYIKRTLEYELTFRKCPNDLRLVAYCDADWASSLDDRHSISGYCISLRESGSPIS